MCAACQSDSNFEDIVYLDCADCKTIKVLPQDLPNLKFLTTYNTNIKDIPVYPNLEALYCFNSPITTLPELPKLRKLIANDTFLTELRGDYYRLEEVNINNTNVSSIPTSLISLTWLSADDTNLETISNKLVSLESLSIANTKIKTIPEMLSMEYLNCSGTGVSHINETECISLRKLVCKGCPIDPFSFKSGMNVMM